MSYVPVLINNETGVFARPSGGLIPIPPPPQPDPIVTNGLEVDEVAVRTPANGAPLFLDGIKVSATKRLQVDEIVDSAGTGAAGFPEGIAVAATKRLRVDEVTDAADTGPPDFPLGVTDSGNRVVTSLTAGTNCSVGGTAPALTIDVPTGAGGVTAVTGTTDEITSSGGTTPALGLANPLVTPGPVTVTGMLSATTIVKSAAAQFDSVSDVLGTGAPAFPNGLSGTTGTFSGAVTDTGNRVLTGLTAGSGSISITGSAPNLTIDTVGGGGTVTSVSGTANQIASTGGTTPVLSLTAPCTTPGPLTSTGSFTASGATSDITCGRDVLAGRHLATGIGGNILGGAGSAVRVASITDPAGTGAVSAAQGITLPSNKNITMAAGSGVVSCPALHANAITDFPGTGAPQFTQGLHIASTADADIATGAGAFVADQMKANSYYNRAGTGAPAFPQGLTSASNVTIAGVLDVTGNITQPSGNFATNGQVKANSITNNGSGAPDFPFGLTATGNVTATNIVYGGAQVRAGASGFVNFDGVNQTAAICPRGVRQATGTPTIAAQSWAGTGATATANGSDAGFHVVLTTGTGPSSGWQFRVTWAIPTANPPRAAFSPSNIAAVGTTGYIESATSTELRFYTTTALAASTEYRWNFVVNQF